MELIKFPESSKIFIDGIEINNITQTNFDEDIKLTQETFSNLMSFEPIEFSGTCNINQNDFKKFIKKMFKLPRKLKKQHGTLKAKKKVFKKVRLGLPINIKDLNRAGLKIFAK